MPIEPVSVLAGIERQAMRPTALVAAPWARLLRLQARRAGLVTPDAVFGLAWSGALTTERLAGLLSRLPAGERGNQMAFLGGPGANRRLGTA